MLARDNARRSTTAGSATAAATASRCSTPQERVRPSRATQRRQPRPAWADAIADRGRGPARRAGSKVAALVGDASNEEGFLVQSLVREGARLAAHRLARRPPAPAATRPRRAAPTRADQADGRRHRRRPTSILVLGTDPMHTSPILDLRVRKAIRRNGARLVVATERPTALDGGAEAIARYAPGEAAYFLGELAAGGQGRRRERRDAAGREPARRRARSSSSGASGSAAARRPPRRRLLELADGPRLAGTRASGLLEIPDITNARGLREVGCLPDAGPGLAEAIERPRRRGDPRRRSSPASSRHWSSSASTRSATSPTRPRWEARPRAADHVVAFSMTSHATTAKADVVFPLETHAEKDGTVTHPDGRLQRVRPRAERPGDIRPGWQVLAELSLALGHETGIHSQPTRLRRPHRGRPLLRRDHRRGDRRPRHPLAGDGSSREPSATARGAELAGDGRLADTPARSRVRRAVPAPERPGVLTLGTYRDLWAGPVTELNPPLKFLSPQQRLELSPADAERLGLCRRRRGPRQPRTTVASSAHVAIRGADARGRLLPRRGHRRRQRQRAC